MKNRWQQVFRLTSRPTRPSAIWAFCFWFWGILGFFGNGLHMLAMTSQTSVGVGSSAYATAGILMWMGGMMLFGIGALITHPEYSVEKLLPPDEPEDTGYYEEQRP